MKPIFTIIFSLLLTTLYAQLETDFFYGNYEYQKVLEHQGKLWVFTGNSVMIIDKNTKESQHFTYDYTTKPNNRFATAAVDDSGNLWAIHRIDGLYKYDGQNWTLENPLTSLMQDEARVLDVFVGDMNIIWIGTNKGIYRLSAGNITKFNLPFSYNYHTITQDKYGVLWIEVGNFLMTFDGTNWKKIDNTNYSFPTTAYFQNVKRDGDDIWFRVGYTDIGYSINNVVGYIDIPRARFQTRVNDIISINRDSFWIGTNRGLIAANRSDTTIIDNQNSPMVNEEIYFLYKDEEKTIWLFGDRGVETVTVNGDWAFHNLYKSTLDYEDIREIVTMDNGKVYLTVGDRVATYDWLEWSIALKNLYWYFISDPNYLRKDANDNIYLWQYGRLYYDNLDSMKYITHPIDFPVIDIEVDNNRKIWAIIQNYDGYGSLLPTYRSIAFRAFDADDWTFDTYGISNPTGGITYYSAIAIDSNNVVWISSDLGLMKIENGVQTVFDINNTNLPNNQINTLTIDRNNQVWVSVFNHGLFLFNGQSFEKKTSRQSDNFVFNSNNEVFFIEDLTVKLVDTTLVTTGFFACKATSLAIDNNDNIFVGVKYSLNYPDVYGGLWVFNENGIEPMRRVTLPVELPTVKTDELAVAAYPNPTNDVTQIVFELEVESEVRIDIYSINGKFVKNGFSGLLDADLHQKIIDLSDLYTGIYVIRVKTNEKNGVVKIIKH